MKGVASLDLGRVPPSLNVSRGGNRGRDSVMKQDRLKQELQQDLWVLILDSKLPKCGYVEARARLRFPVYRERDEGNFRWLLEKALGDALQLARVIPNDTPEHFRFGQLEFDPQRGPERTLVILEYVREDG